MADVETKGTPTEVAQQSSLDPEVWFFPLQNERERVELRHDGEVVCSLSGIAPLTIRVGKALVRMDGVDGLSTPAEHRHKGYASRLIRAVVQHMAEGDAALSMLYGITDFYPRFGYATSGPEHYLLLTQGATRYPMPGGWSARRATNDDFEAIRALYDASMADVVGTELRRYDGRVWSKMRADLAGSEGATGECRVVVDPSGQPGGYLWMHPDFWCVGHFKRYTVTPETTVFAEVIAHEDEAARAALAAARAWDAELRGADAPALPLLIPSMFHGPLADAARFQSAQFVRVYARCGSSMARVLDTPRLMRALLPELDERWKQAHRKSEAVLDLQTEVGQVWLSVGSEGVHLYENEADVPANLPRYEAALPQTMLARLTLGAFRPRELWRDLPQLEFEARVILETLFPERQPHMNVPDRY